MGPTQAAPADRQRQRLGMVAAVLAAIATVFALATGGANAGTEFRTSQHMPGGYGHEAVAVAPRVR